jgi:hypothetical protein
MARPAAGDGEAERDCLLDALQDERASALDRHLDVGAAHLRGRGGAQEACASAAAIAAASTR